jgi:signal transduction histidine kinase
VANRPAPNPPPFGVQEDEDLQQAAQVTQVPVRQTANQRALSANEFQARTQFDTQIANQVFAPRGVEMSVMKPLWLNGQLLLLRRLSLERGLLVQGAWIDWPKVRRQLEATISDLLPGAQLEPVAAGSAGTQDYSHRMAVLPVALNVSRAPLQLGPHAPVRWGLWIIWASVALAIGAIALLLKGVLTLSERRAAFVSAVTHELRTPLTTLRMYAEMLADGMVSEESARSEYLETLRREADRLTHLVENVLAYAQLERGSLPTKIEPIKVAELLKQARDRLTLRAAQGNFKLCLVASRDDLGTTVLADPAAVERILFNLVDNACKYADAASERTLELSASRQSGRLLFKLRDHGPGLSDRERMRLFQPFRKSARDAANSASGIGLGLALSRRLARQLDGELALEDGDARGACFVLNLPLATEN